jgi:MtaA/CmuA family methyltransferase
MRSRVFDILRKPGQEAICSCPLVTCTLDQMEQVQVFYPEAHQEPKAMAKLSEAAYLVVGFEGFRLPFDLCVEAEALGCHMKPADAKSPPSVYAPAFGHWEDFTVAEDLFQRGRFSVVEDALRILKTRYGDDLPIYAGIAGPLTLAGYLFGVEKILKGMIKDPQGIADLLSRVADFSIQYANRLIEAGGNVLAIIDPTATADLISPRTFERFLIPTYQKIRQAIPVPIILHICGNTNPFLSLLQETGFQGFSFEGPTVDVRSAKEAVDNRMALVGNISTIQTLLFGNPERVEEEVKAAVSQGVDLVAPSCGIPLHTPLSNLHAMVSATRKYKRKNDMN